MVCAKNVSALRVKTIIVLLSAWRVNPNTAEFHAHFGVNCYLNSRHNVNETVLKGLNLLDNRLLTVYLHPLSKGFLHTSWNGCFPANTQSWPNAVSMLTHRLRRWVNIETTLGQRFVFSWFTLDLLGTVPNMVWSGSWIHSLSPCSTQLLNLNVLSLEVVSRYRDTQLQVTENLYDLWNLSPKICQCFNIEGIYSLLLPMWL